MPSTGEGGIDTAGLVVTPEAMGRLLEVDAQGWQQQQLPQMHEQYAEFGEKPPAELRAQLRTLEERLGAQA